MSEAGVIKPKREDAVMIRSMVTTLAIVGLSVLSVMSSPGRPRPS